MTATSKAISLIFAISLITFAVSVEPALAAPGGKIASSVFDSFWGKILFAILFIIFLPLIVYDTIREKFAERRARKDLAVVAKRSAQFDYLNLYARAKDCFLRIHEGWENEDLSEASNWMTDWYWQNQQKVYLDKWRSEGLVNICKVKELVGVKPILFSHRNDTGPHVGSSVVLAIKANMQDYLQRKSDGVLIEGSKKFKDVRSIWTFTYEDNCWKVANIDESATINSYLKIAKDLPEIETTLIG